MRIELAAATLLIVGCPGSEEPAGAADTGSAATDTGTAGASTGAPASTSEAADESGVVVDGSSEDGASSSSSGAPDASCAVVGVAGECGDVAQCGPTDAAFQDLCGGVPATQCCVPEQSSCSRLGAPGLCLLDSMCAAPLESSDAPCPGDGLLTCCTDPLTRCGPAAMPLPNEGLLEESWSPECPDGMVFIDSDGFSDPFCIDRYEASLVVLDDDGQVESSWSPYHYPGATRVAAVSLRGAIPQGYISQIRASEACEEADKHLCFGAEWQRACQGDDFNVFPYGNVYDPNACNDTRTQHPAIEYFGTDEPWVFEELAHPCLLQLPDSLHVTGQHPECATATGVLDMMGNLNEWTAGGSGPLRGGYFLDSMSGGPGCYFQPLGYDAHDWDYTTGFRCCADAK